MSDSRAIGVLDSGLGGLCVVRELFRLMPNERIIYFGDTEHFPYGKRSEKYITGWSGVGADALCRYDIKLLVVACNTISAVALKSIEKRIHGIPVIGVLLPSARAAVLRTADKKIGVVGTHATIRSRAYVKAIQKIDSSVKVFENASPLLIPLIEEQMLDHDITRLVAQFYLYEMIDLGVDCLILGCSFYPPLMEVIQGTVGTRMQLLDSALWTAKEVQDILTALDALTGSEERGVSNSSFFFSELPEQSDDLIELFFGRKLPAMELFKLKTDRG